MTPKTSPPPARVRQKRNARDVASPVAKIAAPRLTGVYGRVRLFKVLDSARKRPVIWISAPAGAGKTTLVASYLKARKLPCLWYQIDVRDLDPAAFFYYLREAIRKHSPRKHETLPLLTPEYLAGLPTFTRNFFEALFARMRGPAAVVFDNFQDVPESAVLQQLLPEALSIIPEGIAVFILSRTAPPAPFARLQAQRAMQVLDADSLQLTLAEARGIARLHKTAALNVKTLEKLHKKVRGWTAGWILLLERLRESDLTVSDIPREAREALFDYFAAELFDHAAPEVQTLLLKTSLLPQVAVSSAEALTGETGAAGILAELDRRNYFTTRLTANELVYQFHPLFREFLSARAKQQLPVEERRSLQQKAAQILSGRGQYDEAAMLLIESSDWDGLSRLIHTQAPILAQQGRLATLEGWLRALPAETVEQQPWLLYWLGVCRMPHDLPEARSLFERAYAIFEQKRDPAGLYSAWAGVVESFLYQWDDFSPIDRWLDELIALQQTHDLAQYPEIEARVAYAVLTALTLSRLDRPETPEWARRTEALLLKHADHALLEIPILTGLNTYYCFIGALGKTRPLAERILRYVTRLHVEPFVRISSCFTFSVSSWSTGDSEAAEHWVTTGLKLGEQSGIRALEPLLLGQGCAARHIADDVEGVAKYLARFQQILHHLGRLDVAHYYYNAAWLAWRRGEFTLAREYAEKSLALAEVCTAYFPLTLIRIVCAQVLVEFGEFDQAEQQLTAGDDLARRMGSSILVFTCGLTRAWAALRQGQPEACASALAQALAFGRQQGYFAYGQWNVKLVTPLCQFALERNIETDYVRDLIRRRRLIPDELFQYLDNWPWPLKIHTLGGFRIEKDGEAIRFSGKVQRRPLDLLKITIALGGREVDTKRIIDELWPEAEGDAAEDALATALRRLRLLLGNPAVLVLQDNKLTMDTRSVWVDVWALEYLFNQKDPAKVDFSQVLTLYQGAFLEKDAEASWVWPLRERLRQRFLRELTKQGRLLMQANQYEEAMRLFEKGLDVDNLAEEFYCNLMRCHQALGRRAEALSTYERCRKLLSVTLGVTPSPETEAVARAIQASRS